MRSVRQTNNSNTNLMITRTMTAYFSQNSELTKEASSWKTENEVAVAGNRKKRQCGIPCSSAFPTYILASDFALLRLLTWWCHRQFAPPSVNGLSSQQRHPRGMICLILSVLPHQCCSSEVDSRQNYSRVHTSNLTELSPRHLDSTFLFHDRDL